MTWFLGLFFDWRDRERIQLGLGQYSNYLHQQLQQEEDFEKKMNLVEERRRFNDLQYLFRF